MKRSAACVVCVLSLFAWNNLTPVCGQQPSEDAPALSNIGGAMPECFTMEVERELPAILLAPGQGNITQRARITVGSDVTAITWRTLVFPEPKYYPPDGIAYQSSVDYDAEGNLLLAMPSEGVTIRDGERHDDYTELTGFRVAPDGTVVERTFGGSHVRRYDPSFTNTEGMGTLRVIRWTLGRPPGGVFAELEAQQTRPDGIEELRVAGQSSPYSGPGVWHLKVDPGEGYLVREANFAYIGLEPRVRLRTEGTRRYSDVVLAERGEYFQGPQHISVRLISYSPKESQEIVEEARKIIARTKTRMVRVSDQREDPAHPKGRIYRAGELDLESDAQTPNPD